MGPILILTFLFYSNVTRYACYRIRTNDSDHWLTQIKCEGVVSISEPFASTYTKIITILEQHQSKIVMM